MCTSYKPHSEWQKADRCHSDMFNSGATPQRKTDDWLIFTNNIIKLNLAKRGISFLKCSMFIDVNVSIITSNKKTTVQKLFVCWSHLAVDQIPEFDSRCKQNKHKK